MNLPNKITVLRIVLIPAFLFVYLVGPFAELVNMWVALLLFVTAAITDAIDGYLARKLKLESNFGKLMDPLADKLLACSTLVAFVHTGVVPVWAVIVIIAREFYISGLRQLALEQGIVLAASASGKFKMVLQMVLIIYVILPTPFTLLVFPVVVTGLVIITTLASVYSAVDYTRRNIRLFCSTPEGR